MGQGTPAKLWMRGRNNFDGLVSYLQTDLGMGDATEVILSGGSAGGLAVFYNLDHLATLLPEGVRLTGFPDAGFFLDAQNVQGEYLYRSYFQSADPVWNVTGSGGTNLKCLAAHTDEKWKCLMAPYIAPHIETPFFVMNSAYDAWQMRHVLQTQCIPAPNRGPCSADQNATMQSFHDKFVKDIASVTDGKPKNGVYVDSCYVHEQNVNYCSNQGMPNCVGCHLWRPVPRSGATIPLSRSAMVALLHPNKLLVLTTVATVSLQWPLMRTVSSTILVASILANLFHRHRRRHHLYVATAVILPAIGLMTQLGLRPNISVRMDVMGHLKKLISLYRVM